MDASVQTGRIREEADGQIQRIRQSLSRWWLKKRAWPDQPEAHSRSLAEKLGGQRRDKRYLNVVAGRDMKCPFGSGGIKRRFLFERSAKLGHRCSNRHYQRLSGRRRCHAFG